jgi:multidrug efflux pump subunit AcrA (membrane-fusion protein)
MRVMLKIIIVAVMVAAGVWAYRANTGSKSGAMDMNMRVTSGNTPFPVTLAAVERGAIAGAVTYTGSVAAFNEEDIFARVMGRIVEMTVYPGDRVERGQIVARLDDAELGSQVRAAEAMLATARANRLQMEAELTAAKKGTIQMEAETGYQLSVASRDEELFTKGAISKEEAENSRAMATTARAKVEQMRAMENAAGKKLEASNAMVAQSEAQLRTAQVVRGYVEIAAPSSGYVVKRLVAPGVLVGPGMAILKTTQTDKVRLQANVGEKDLTAIKVGSPVTGTTADGQATITAQVTSVFPYVEQDSRTAVIEAVVDNPERRFIPGQFVRMQFTTGTRQEALTVPSGAVSRLGGKVRVWVLQEGRVEPREVVTGLENPDRVEILKGLAGDERVVAQGYEGLYAGAPAEDASITPAPANPHEGMAGMGEPPAKTKEPEKATEMKNMPGHGTQAPQAGGAALAPAKLKIALPGNAVTLAAGSATLLIEVKDASGAPVSDAVVEVHAGMSGMDSPKVTARAGKKAGVYEAALRLGMAGTWTVEITATRPQEEITTEKFNLEAR